MKPELETVLVTGGAGYVGAVLTPRLLAAGYRVKVYDLYLYGREPLEAVRGHAALEEIEGDLRDTDRLRHALRGCDAVIHLACISNDPSVELDPDLSRTINFEAFEPLVRGARDAGVRRFIFASSGSVYGVSEDPDVTEEHPLVPVSLYNKYKALCEPVLLEAAARGFDPVIIRPATICGYSPRQRLDLTVNILTNHAVNADKITVYGGSQMRPNLHMADMIALYLKLLEYPAALIRGEIFNAAYENFSVAETAERIRRIVATEVPGKQDLPIVTTPSDDIRSYHISSAKLRRVLGFAPQHTIEDGARDLIAAFGDGRLPDSLTDERYFNIRRMKAIDLR
ncbi:MAG: NAD-dependent epimerase/dehydratase family protein [Candidatus Marinimicrobia bacterium]|nr:NAD-dependent epimerase/dehydratase family protein [Candidatus Neomarinimicrobiota bacterium]